MLPDSNTERTIIYISGPSGSGKSYFSKLYLKEFKKNKKFKKSPIYIISSLTEDESLDDIPNLKRIKIDESMYEDPIDITDFEPNDVVVFDDIDVISDKKIRESIYKLLNKVLEIGRHYRINCIITNHLPSNGVDTRRILNECHQIVYFPQSSNHKIRYVLENYIGLSGKQVKYIKNLNTRWAVIYKNFPQLYLTQHEVGLLSYIDEDH